MAHTCQDCRNSLEFCFHSDLLRISIFFALLAHPGRALVPPARSVLRTPSVMNIRQKSVNLAHQAARQWQGPPLSTAAFVMLGCCTTQLAVGSFSEQLLVHKFWQFSWSSWFGRHAKLHALHSPCDFFWAAQEMWMSNWQGYAGWHVRELPATWFELFLYGVRGLLSPGASRVCPIEEWEQSLQMPHSRQMQCHTCHLIDLSFVMWGSCCSCLRDGVCEILELLPPSDCRVWGRLRWMWMWMLWQLRMATASTAQPAQPAQSVLQATRRSCVRAAHQTSFLRVSAASNAPKRLILVQPRPSSHLSLHWSLRLVQSFGYGCGGQFKPNNLQALSVHWWNKWRLRCRSCCNFVTRWWLSLFGRQWDPICFNLFFQLVLFCIFFPSGNLRLSSPSHWRRSALGCSGGVGGQNGWEELWKIAILGASLCPDHPIFSVQPEGCLQFAVSIWSLGRIFGTKKNLLQHINFKVIPETTSRLMGHTCCAPDVDIGSFCFKETRS